MSTGFRRVVWRRKGSAQGALFGLLSEGEPGAACVRARVIREIERSGRRVMGATITRAPDALRWICRGSTSENVWWG